MGRGFPGIITSLPEADIKFESIKGWIVQGEDCQIAFMEIQALAVVPEHSHDAQWGIVVEGKMELTIEGKTRICKKGDEYFIPSKAKHSAKFLTNCRIIDFFSEKARFRPR